MRVIKAPEALEGLDGKITVFAAGTIENGTAENWQHNFEAFLRLLPQSDDIVLLNPRRDVWHPDWKPVASNPDFVQQVEWELDGMELADLIVYNFVPGTKSAITIGELYLHVREQNIIVCCPEGFWRKGNVDILCQRFCVDVHDDRDSFYSAVADWFEDRAKGE